MFFASRRPFSPIGLDLGSACIKAIQLDTPRGARPSVSAAAVIPRLQPGEPIKLEEIQRALDSLARQGFAGRRLIVGMPADRLLTGVMELPPKVHGPALFDIARLELARSHKCDPSQLEMDLWELPGGARAAEGTHVMAVGCKNTDADALLDLFAAAGVEVAALDSPPVALARACAPMFAPESELTTIVDIGARATTMLILKGRTLVYERSVPELGIATLLTTLRARLELEPDAAQYVAERVGCAADRAPDQADWEQLDQARAIIAAHADALAQELKVSLGYATRRYAGGAHAVLVTGGGSAIPGFTDRIASHASLSTVRAVMESLVAVPSVWTGICTHPALAVALGLALHDQPERLSSATPQLAAASAGGAR